MTNKDKIRKAITALDDEFIEERRRGHEMVKWIRLDIADCYEETVIINVDKIDYILPEVNLIGINGWKRVTVTQSCMDKLVEHIFKKGDT